MVSYIANNGLQIGHIWLDIEPTSGTCNAWNLGSTANTNLARQYTSLARSSQYSWGVYANANQWSGMFGSTSVNVGSDLPLWAVQADGTPGVNTVTRFMGGWTTAYARQYQIGKSFKHELPSHTDIGRCNTVRWRGRFELVPWMMTCRGFLSRNIQN
jgi:hypothetical protein